MNNETLFSEKQSFKQWWLWIILLVLNGFLMIGVYNQFVRNIPFGNRPMSDVGLLIVACSLLLVTLLLISIRLETNVKNDGIYVRFFPFQLKFKHYSWEKLTKSFVRKYSPLGEYGGWGLRVGFSGKGTAYNISGNQGLQLEFTDNKKLLIGTSKPELLTETLHNIGQLKQ